MAEHRNRNLAGIMLAAVSSFLVILLGAVGKKLGGELSPFVIVFLYGLFSFVTFLPALLRGGGFRRVSSRVPGIQAIRAGLFAAALIGWFWALSTASAPFAVPHHRVIVRDQILMTPTGDCSPSERLFPSTSPRRRNPDTDASALAHGGVDPKRPA